MQPMPLGHSPPSEDGGECLDGQADILVIQLLK